MSIQKVEVPEGYHCPFCLDHEDDVFFRSTLVGQPICEGCAVELSSFAEERIQPNDYLIDELVKHTGLSWRQCRIELLRESLEDWRTIEREKSPEWLKTTLRDIGWTEEEAWQYVSDQIECIETMLAEIQAKN